MKTLSKRLGPLDGAILIFSNVVGVGIFTTPGIVAVGVPNTWMFMATWCLGGLYAFIGAMGYARLATAYPKAGGEYIYLKNAFGPLAGYLSGWTSYVAGFSGAIAASAVGFAIYLKRAIPTLSGTFVGISLDSWLAIGLIGLVALIHLLSVKAGSRFHYWLGGLAIVAILALVGIGVFSELSVKSSIAPAPVSGSAFLLAMIPVLFTYSGWNAAVYISEEIHKPKKNMLKALVLGTASVVFIYLMLNLLFVKVLGTEKMGNSLEVGFDLADALLGKNGSLVISTIILLALLSSVSAMIMAGPRIYFAMARDGLFPKGIARLHSRFKTPSIAIVAQAGWSVLLVLSGTFEDILIYTGFSIILFSGLSVAVVLVHREFKTNSWQKLIYGLFVTISLFILINAIYSKPGPSLFGAGIILVGIPIYYWFKRQGSKL